MTIEFVGPLTLAVVGSRRPRDLLWVLLAGVGVALLGIAPGDLTLAGVLFALVAGAAWAAYIVLSAQTGRRWPGPRRAGGGEHRRHPAAHPGGARAPVAATCSTRGCWRSVPRSGC